MHRSFLGSSWKNYLIRSHFGLSFAYLNGSGIMIKSFVFLLVYKYILTRGHLRVESSSLLPVNETRTATGRHSFQNSTEGRVRRNQTNSVDHVRNDSAGSDAIVKDTYADVDAEDNEEDNDVDVDAEDNEEDNDFDIDALVQDLFPHPASDPWSLAKRSRTNAKAFNVVVIGTHHKTGTILMTKLVTEFAAALREAGKAVKVATSPFRRRAVSTPRRFCERLQQK